MLRMWTRDWSSAWVGFPTRRTGAAPRSVTVLLAGRRLAWPQEAVDLGQEVAPRGVALGQQVVAAVEGDQTTSGDQRGQDPRLLEHVLGLAPSAQDEGGGGHLGRQVGHVDVGELVEEAPRVLGGRRPALELVELTPLLLGPLGEEPGDEH